MYFNNYYNFNALSVNGMYTNNTANNSEITSALFLWQHATLCSTGTIKTLIIKVKLIVFSENDHILMNIIKAVIMQCIMQNTESHHPFFHKP
jgi:hypothetical protein